MKLSKPLSLLTMILLLLPLSSYCAFTQGGAMGGNGGDAVVCRDFNGKIRSAEAFDAYEAKAVRNLSSDIDPSTSRETTVSILLGRLAVRSPVRVEEYRTWWMSFNVETHFVSGQELVGIPDSGAISFPYGCKIEQLIIQSEPVFPGDLRYTINQDIWKEMSPRDQGIMTTHELLMREMKHGTDELFDTRSLRYLNSTLFSNLVSKLDDNAWLGILSNVERLEYVEAPAILGRVLKSDFVRGENRYLFLLPRPETLPRYKFSFVGTLAASLEEADCNSSEYRIAASFTEAGVELSGWNEATGQPDMMECGLKFGAFRVGVSLRGLTTPFKVSFQQGDAQHLVLKTSSFEILQHDAASGYNIGYSTDNEMLQPIEIEFDRGNVFTAKVSAQGPVIKSRLYLFNAEVDSEPIISNGFTVNADFRKKISTVSFP